MVDEMTISEVAKRVGVRASTLRYYESVGLISSPKRVGGKRRYDASVLKQLAIIQLTKQSGFTVTQMQTLLSHEQSDTTALEHRRKLARQKLTEVEILMNQMSQMKQLLEKWLHSGYVKLEDCPLVTKIMESYVKD